MTSPSLMATVHGFTRPTMAAGLLILATVPSECMPPAYGPETGPPVGEYAPGPTSQGYGVGGGQLTAQQVALVRSLGWPQARADLVGALGFPSSMTQFADYYTAPDGRQLTIHYSGPDAVGYSLE